MVNGRLYTTDDLASALNVSKSSIYNWVKTGKLHPQRAGKLMRFYEQDVDRFLEENATQVLRAREHAPTTPDGATVEIPLTLAEQLLEVLQRVA